MYLVATKEVELKHKEKGGMKHPTSYRVVWKEMAGFMSPAESCKTGSFWKMTRYLQGIEVWKWMSGGG